MQVKAVKRAPQHFGHERASRVRTLDDLEGLLSGQPNDQAGHLAIPEWLFGSKVGWGCR
jgi:hypothetical protein